MPVKKLGNTICISIYDLAHLIGDEAENASAPSPVKTSAAAKTSASRNPMRRPSSLGKLLKGYAKRMEELAVKVEAERTLFSELEAIALGHGNRPVLGF